MKIEIKKVKLSEIKPNPDNPRIIKTSAFQKLVKSLKDFPEMKELREIVVDENMVILGGNMRYKALLKLKEQEVTAKIVYGLTDEQKKEFIIKDNLNYGDWDYSLLSEQNFLKLEKLNEFGLDIPLLSIDIKELKEERKYDIKVDKCPICKKNNKIEIAFILKAKSFDEIENIEQYNKEAVSIYDKIKELGIENKQIKVLIEKL